jgi:hypothetical protein
MFNVFSRLCKLVRNLHTIVSDCLSFFANVGRRRLALAAENLFLRKQLALFREREKKAMPTTPADRFVFSKLARWFDWRSALVIVKPATLIGWHHAAFRRFWRWKSRPVGRPRVTTEIRDLIRRLAAENPTWGEKGIADELLLKLEIRLFAHRRQVQQATAPATQVAGPALVHLPEKSRPSNRGLRFLHRCDRRLSRHLCVCRPRNRIAASDSFQCDRASDIRVDFAAAARSAARRSGIQVSLARSPQDLLGWFGRRSREMGYCSTKTASACANGECLL